MLHNIEILQTGEETKDISKGELHPINSFYEGAAKSHISPLQKQCCLFFPHGVLGMAQK